MENNFKIDIVREISLVYELSLSIGNSLDLKKNCADFLSVWMRQKNIDFGSIWLKNDVIGKENPNNYSLIYANPEFRVVEKEASLNHNKVAQLKENGAIYVNHTMALFREFIQEKNITEGCYWIIPLQNLGFIKFYFSLNNLAQNTFDTKELKKTNKVLEKFCITIQSCLLYKKGIETENELRQAKEKVEEAGRVKQEFLSVVSHEIRTPLNAILGMTNLIQKTTLSPLQSDYINTVQVSAENLQGIIHSILDFSKMEMGKISLQKIPFNLRKILQNIINSNEFKAEQKGIGLFLKFDESINQTLLGDSIRLSQVLLNLVSNAIKFTSLGQIEIEARLITKLNNALVIEFSVSDTGKGIAEDKLNVIFESFVQEDSSISRKYGGTGLGLSISKSLVNLMGGDLKVKSAVNQGSKFSFIVGFSISQEPVEEVKERIFVGNSLVNKRVLLVEDNAMNQFFAQKLLEGWGMKVEIAQNGIEGIEKFKLKHFDCILMDIQMPQMDGFQATKIIRQSNQQLPIIALTAFAVEDEIKHFKEAGMNDFITKPFEAEHLQQKLLKYLSKQQTFSLTQNKSSNEKLEKLYNSQLLNQMMKGNTVQIRQMETLFVKQSNEAIIQFNAFLVDKNWRQIGLLAHKIKASIDMLQINSLKQPIRQLETLGKQENPNQEIQKYVKLCTETLKKVCDEIEESHQ